jgi:hypothetical protein
MSIVTLDMSTYEVEYCAPEYGEPVGQRVMHAPCVAPGLQEVTTVQTAERSTAMPPHLLGVDPAEFLEWVAG